MFGKLIGNLLGRREPPAGGASFTERDTTRLQTALSLANAGRSDEAERIYRELLSAHPDHVDLLHLLGNAALARSSPDEAIELLQRAAAAEPAAPELNLHLGDAHAARGEDDRAIDFYGRAVAAKPELTPAHVSLGRILHRAGRLNEAEASYRRALALRSDSEEICIALAAVLRERGETEAALAEGQRALGLNPGSPDAHVCCAHALRDLGRPEEAIAAYRRAVDLSPQNASARLHLGNALFLDGHDITGGAREFMRALELDPKFDEARFNLALTHLARGDYARGWPDYELRRLNSDWPRRPVEYPPWTGQDLKGKKLLVFAEQGLGDQIMFASGLPAAIERGAQCIVECAPKLETLFRRSFPATTVYRVNAERAVPSELREEGIDFELPIGSLPLHLRRTRAEFPPHHGYLKADADATAAWRRRLEDLGQGLKVGISWQGGTQKSRRLARSLPLERLLPVLRTPSIQFVDLQYKDCSAEIAAIDSKHGIRVHSWEAARSSNYDDAAALVSALDLVISVCTAVIHLGGALGRPVWVMVPYGCEWRYGYSEPDMPWYPSVRLLRQDRLGNWDPVIAEIAHSLTELAQMRVLS